MRKGLYYNMTPHIPHILSTWSCRLKECLQQLLDTPGLTLDSWQTQQGWQEKLPQITLRCCLWICGPEEFVAFF